jgi:hypothetical protein
MVKYFILLNILLIVTLSHCLSQIRDPESLLFVSSGPSFPIGNFASTNSKDELAGFAKTGEEVVISYIYQLNQTFGLTAALFGQRNGLNTQRLKRQLSQQAFVYPSFSFAAGNVSVPPSSPPPNYVYYSNWMIRKHDWLSGSLLLGGAGMIPLKRESKWIFVIKGLAGIAYVSSPRIDGSSTTDTTNMHIGQSSKSAWGFSYMAYGGFNYKVDNKFSFLLGINYFGTAKIRFSGVASEVSTFYHSGQYASMSKNVIPTTQKQNIQTIGLNLGVALQL